MDPQSRQLRTAGGAPMTLQLPRLADLAADLKVAISFSTRLPIVHATPVTGIDVARAVWALPLAGACIALIGALVYWVAYRAGLPALPAATLSLAATVITTGCLHEDGLADVADGFGGGSTRERKLEIMNDSRIGTFGACALVLSMLLRAGAIASLAQPALVMTALLAAHIGARAILPPFMWLVPPARREGLAAGAGRPPETAVIIAAVVGAIAIGVGLGPATGLITVAIVIVAAVVIAWLSLRQINGQTGDVLGAVEQVSEILILLAAARF
jgi:adenosylcobinamide-GDP ribazoletransferase